jgi:hypothetical protein
MDNSLTWTNGRFQIVKNWLDFIPTLTGYPVLAICDEYQTKIVDGQVVHVITNTIGDQTELSKFTPWNIMEDDEQFKDALVTRIKEIVEIWRDSIKNPCVIVTYHGYRDMEMALSVANLVNPQ